jgi:hypothetical protein
MTKVNQILFPVRLCHELDFLRKPRSVHTNSRAQSKASGQQRSQSHQKSPNPARVVLLPRSAVCQWTCEAGRCGREWQGRTAPRRRVLPGMARPSRQTAQALFQPPKFAHTAAFWDAPRCERFAPLPLSERRFSGSSNGLLSETPRGSRYHTRAVTSMKCSHLPVLRWPKKATRRSWRNIATAHWPGVEAQFLLDRIGGESLL